jgi:hypothetical protein
MELEIEASLSLLVGRDLTTVGPVDMIGYGGLWPFGMVARIKSSDAAGQDTTEHLRAAMGPEAFDDLEREMQMYLLNGGDGGHPQGTAGRP